MKLKQTSLMFSRRRRRDSASGVALITTLLLLMLMSGMVVAMVWSVNSDMLINGYYRDFRGSFYAADSGLAVVRQSIANQLLATIPTVFLPSVQPILLNTENAVLLNTVSTYGGTSYTSLGSGQSSSLPATFQLDPRIDSTHASLALSSCNPSAPFVSGATCLAPCPTGCTSALNTPTLYTYIYKYHLLVYGRSRGLQKSTLEESGSLTLAVNLTAASNTPSSFAAWGMFIDSSPACSGSYLVQGTISGPVFTNGAWNFGSGSQYIFTDTVGSVSPTAGFQNSRGDCVASTSHSASGVSTTYAVQPQWGQSAMPLPTNDFSQQRAVIDGIGILGQPSSTDKTSALKDVREAAYPSTTPSTGVFLPYTVDPSPPHAATFTGGGILVEGNADVKLSMGTLTVGLITTPTQIYTITQGNVITTITVDNLNNTTLFHDGIHPDVPIAGVPSQRNSAGGALTPSTMLYVDGNITGLYGPGEGPTHPAIQDGTALTITASGNVTITGDIRYATEPVTTTQNQGTPADTLIALPAGKGAYLGIFTATKDIQMDNSQNDGNLWIDASIATISQSGGGGLVNTGANINTLTIVGGRIQNALKAINATTRNVFFDRRYSAVGVAPPWFPSTTTPHPGSDSALPTTPSFQRLQWVNQTPYL